MDNTQLLIALLKCIEKDNTIESGLYDYLKDHSLVSAVKYLADKCLIDDKGYPHTDNIDKVINEGFSIYPGEKDRFGWLTGCIELSKGIIVFG
jgi:hypothetical protein